MMVKRSLAVNMNFVMPILNNSSENISLSDKWELSHRRENNEKSTIAVMTSFTAMIVGASCMVCFVGKLLSKWYSTGSNSSESRIGNPTMMSIDITHLQPTDSISKEDSVHNQGDLIEMKPIGGCLRKGSMKKK